MFLFLFSSCSFFYENKDHAKKQNNNLNKEIINNFTKALSKNPDNSLFYLERGKTKHNYGDYIGAIKDFNDSLRLNPNSKAIFNRANSKYAYGDYNGAIKDYEKFISRNIFQDQVFYSIANSQFILLEYEKAIENYSKSIEYDQDEENAYLNRGNAKFKINDY